MTERLPLLELHALQSRLPDLIAKKGEPPWVVLRGEIDWYIEGQTAPIHARAGDFVFGPKHLWHHLEPVGHEPSVRIAINARGEFHRYDRSGCKPL